MKQQLARTLLDAVINREEFFANQPAYRSLELRRWILEKQIFEVAEYTNLSKSLRQELVERYPNVLPLSIAKVIQSSKDRTKKFLLETLDGQFIEAVLIDHEKSSGYTLCLSSQIGCPLACDFCATGMMKWKRNLSPAEILAQYFLLQSQVNTQGEDGKDGDIERIVFMGMGEPFLNLAAVKTAVETLTALRQGDCANSKEKAYSGLGWGASRISLSTSGVLNGIRELGHWEKNVNLSLSLHSAVQETRDLIMADFKNVPLTALRETLVDYQQKKKGAILVEYIMIEDVNDSDEELEALIDYLKGLYVKINLIAYNHVPGKPYAPTSPLRLRHFQKGLREARFAVTQRYKKGDDIAAACGQLSAETLTPAPR